MWSGALRFTLHKSGMQKSTGFEWARGQCLAGIIED
jgi:hypothetical protein